MPDSITASAGSPHYVEMPSTGDSEDESEYSIRSSASKPGFISESVRHESISTLVQSTRTDESDFDSEVDRQSNMESSGARAVVYDDTRAGVLRRSNVTSRSISELWSVQNN